MKSLNTWGYDMTDKWVEVSIFVVRLVCLGVVIYEIAEIIRIAV